MTHLTNSGTGTAAERLYAALRARILSLDLPPDRTLSRQALSDEFQVSLTPVRDALQQLERDGLVEVLPQSGTRVRRIDRQSIFEAQFLRVAAETELARRLARMGETDALDKAEHALSDQNTCLQRGDVTGFAAGDKAFHRALFLGVGMGGVHERLWAGQANLLRCQNLAPLSADGLNRVLLGHADILERIGAGDPDGAGAAMRAHLSDALARVAEMQERYPDCFDKRGTGPG